MLLKSLGLLLFIPALAAPSPVPGNEMPNIRFLEKAESRVVPLTDAAKATPLKIAGAPATVVVVWASWCGFCRAHMQRLRGFYKVAQDRGLRVHAVSVDENASEATAEAAKMQYQFPIHHDSKGTLRKTLDVTKLPEVYVTDAEGEVVAVYRGMSNDRFGYLRKRVLAMLGQAED